MGARTRKVVLTDDWKAGVKASNIIHRLYQCSLGEVKMTSEQLQAAKIVLAKILPDLKAMDLNVEGTINVVDALRLLDRKER